MSRAVIGFSDQVTIGAHGARLQGNPEVVLRVEFPGGNLVSFVLSANLHRRHMTPGQQAVTTVNYTHLAVVGAEHEQVGRLGEAEAAFTSVGRQIEQLGVNPRIEAVIESFVMLPLFVEHTDRLAITSVPSWAPE